MKSFISNQATTSKGENFMPSVISFGTEVIDNSEKAMAGS